MSGPITLPFMSADPGSVTVSGHSSGCYMTQEMAIVKSESIQGAGLFQCWPFEMLENEAAFLETTTE